MANLKPNSDDIQPDFFRDSEYSDIERLENYCADIRHELRAALVQSLKTARRSGITRERIVDRMNQVLSDELGKVAIPVTKRKLDAWTAASKEDRPIPAELVPAFCIATGCTEPLEVQAQTIDMTLANLRDVRAMRLGHNHMMRARLNQEDRELQKQLKR